MNLRYLYILVAGTFMCLQPIKAERTNEIVNDTIKTYNIGEVIITSPTKETNDLRTLPGAISILSPQAIAARQIDALKDISAFGGIFGVILNGKLFTHSFFPLCFLDLSNESPARIVFVYVNRIVDGF